MQDAYTSEERCGDNAFLMHRDNVVMTPHFGGGVGLAGIEAERADAVFSTAVEALASSRRPCGLELGY